MMLAYPGERSKMADRLAKEYFIIALDDPKLEFQVREKEPQTLDSALKIAQRLEMFKNAVKHRANQRRRYSRQVVESSDTESDGLTERVAKIEQSMQKSQKQSQRPRIQHQQQQPGKQVGSPKKKKTFNKQQVCAATETTDVAWKEALLKRVQELEAAQQVTEAKNDALSKEIGRLRHLEQLRSVPTPAVYTTASQRNAARPQVNIRKCFNCDQPGHFFRSCPHPRRRDGVTMQFNAQNNFALQVNGAAGSSKSNHNSYLRVIIGDSIHNCLLDTGSDSTP